MLCGAEYVRSSHRLSVDLTESDALNLSLLHELSQDAHGLFDRSVWVLSGAFEDIDALLSVQDSQTLVYASSDVLLRAIWYQGTALQTTLDAQNHFVCVFGILGEVSVEKMQRVALGSTVQLPAVPEVGTELQRRVQGFEGYFITRGSRIPGQSCNCDGDSVSTVRPVFSFVFFLFARIHKIVHSH